MRSSATALNVIPALPVQPVVGWQESLALAKVAPVLKVVPDCCSVPELYLKPSAEVPLTVAYFPLMPFEVLAPTSVKANFSSVADNF